MTTTSTQPCCDNYAKWKNWGLNSNTTNAEQQIDNFSFVMGKDFLWFYRTYVLKYEESVLIWNVSESQTIRSEFLLEEDNFAIQVASGIFQEIVKREPKILIIFTEYSRSNWSERECCENGGPKGKLTILRNLIDNMYSRVVRECDRRTRNNGFHCTTIKDYLANLLLRISLDFTDSRGTPFRSAVLSKTPKDNTPSSEPNIILSESVCSDLVNQLKSQLKSASVDAFPDECELCCPMTPICYDQMKQVQKNIGDTNRKISDTIDKYLSLCGPNLPRNQEVNFDETNWERWQ